MEACIWNTIYHNLFFSPPLSLLLSQMDIQQMMLYCDPSLAIQEACCEIPGARVRPATLHY